MTQPDELTIARKRVLFLGKMREINRRTPEVVRRPLENGEVSISRAPRRTMLSAEIVLVRR